MRIERNPYNPTLKQKEVEPLQDHCGIVAIFSGETNQLFCTALEGLKRLQTRGYDGAGCLAFCETDLVKEHKAEGIITEVFSDLVIEDLKKTEAHTWLFQTRYGTSGNFNQENVQPFRAKHLKSKQEFGVIHNGQFSQEDEGTSSSDTYIFTQQLAQATESNFDQAICNLLNRKRGAWSLIIGTVDGLYLARDPFGIRPFVYGYKTNSKTRAVTWYAASETSALETMGVVDIFEVLPGSILRINEKGISTLQAHQPDHPRAHCIFENVYISEPDSKALYLRDEPETVRLAPLIKEIRTRCGEILASEAPLGSKDVDLVIGVPGTGIPGGKGYAQALGLEYGQAITDRTPQNDQRTFMSAQKDSILQKVLSHYNFDAAQIKGKRLVLVDDSIVRGNVSQGLIRLLKSEYGAKEVHLRVLSPMIDKGCHLGINTRKGSELIAYRHLGDIESMRQELEADSLVYLSAEGLQQAHGGMDGFCMGCMVGHEPPLDQQGTFIPVGMIGMLA